jgi:hypothetical protein
MDPELHSGNDLKFLGAGTVPQDVAGRRLCPRAAAGSKLPSEAHRARHPARELHYGQSMPEGPYRWAAGSADRH